MTSTNVCNGLNIYDGAGESEPLREGAKPPELTFGALRCSDASMGMFDLESFAEIEPGFDEDTNCGPDDVGEMEAYSIDNGQLVYASGNINNVGGECTCVAWLPVSEATCPSSLDPCGSPRSFPALAGVEAIWVTTDARHALTVENGSLSVYVRDRDAALRSLEAPSEILGVEFHPDTVLLDAPEAPAQLRPNIPARDDSDADFEGSAKAWGNRCFAHFKAGRLAAAEAACYDGLAAGGSEPTRGALTYNLGRIAEARGDQSRALAYYYRSDGLRPGNAAVTERIATLAPH
jgi:tetratricopeptide (TPR) repeat protein